MRRSRLKKALLSLYATVAAYCVLSIIAGPGGLIAYRELAAGKEAMAANLQSLGRVNEGLRDELESLRADPGRASREARALGYLAPGEVELVLEGREAPRPERHDAGAVVKADYPKVMSDALIKELSLGFGLLLFALLLSPNLGLGTEPGRPRRAGRDRPSAEAPVGQLF